jgi:hypothetical protein
MTRVEAVRIAWDFMVMAPTMVVACALIGALIAMLERAARRR